MENNKLKGRKAIVTAGPTYEPIDPVRFIGNHSTGKMGYAIAEVLRDNGANVVLISGPSALASPLGINTIRVQTADEMHKYVQEHKNDTEIIVLSAAVADYRPKTVADQKIKKNEDEFTLELVKNIDIAKAVGDQKTEGQRIIGFALETQNEEANALTKLKKKNFDMIVLNSMQNPDSCFGSDTNKIVILDKNNRKVVFDNKPKKEVAIDIINHLINEFYA